jgi:hypothetical protein
MRKDLHSHISVEMAKNQTDITTSTTTAGIIIDTKGYRSIEFALFCGTRTDGTYTPKIEEGDDSGSLSDAVNVTDSTYLLGTLAGAALTASNTVKRVGYRVGNKRYVRLSVVSTTVSSGCTAVGAIAIKSTADQEPIA